MEEVPFANTEREHWFGVVYELVQLLWFRLSFYNPQRTRINMVFCVECGEKKTARQINKDKVCTDCSKKENTGVRETNEDDDPKKKGKKGAAVKFPCGNCNMTTSGCAALMCNICELWHHNQCIPGMTKEGYQQLVSMKDSMGYSFFLCGKCEKVHKKTWQAVNNMGKRLDSFETRLGKVENLMKDYEEKQKETNTKVEKVEAKTVASSTSVQTSVLSEIQEQENRKTNIVVYNLKESMDVDGTVRKDHDLSEIGSLLQQIELPNTIKEDIAVIRRLGKRLDADGEHQNEGADSVSTPAKPRPLLVSFKSPITRKEILGNAKKLSKSQLKHISVCPDLTKNQQKEDKKLREEVKQLNTENPSDEKGDFLWKVVGVSGQSNRRKVKIYQQDPNATH